MNTETRAPSLAVPHGRHSTVWHTVPRLFVVVAFCLLGGCVSYDSALKASARLEDDALTTQSRLDDARTELDRFLEEYRVAMVRAWTVKAEYRFWSDATRVDLLSRFQAGYGLAVAGGLPTEGLFSLWQGPSLRARDAVDDAKGILIADVAHPFDGPAVILGARAYIARSGLVRIAVLRPVKQNPGKYTVVIVSNELDAPALSDFCPWWFLPYQLKAQGGPSGEFVARAGDVPAIYCPDAAALSYTEYPVGALGETLGVADVAASAVGVVGGSLTVGTEVTVGAPLARAYSFALLAASPPGTESSPAPLLGGSQVTPSILPPHDGRVLAQKTLRESKKGLEADIASTLDGMRSARGDAAALASASKEEKKRVARELAAANGQVRAKLGEAPKLLADYGSAERGCARAKEEAVRTTTALGDDVKAERAAYDERWRRLRQLARVFTTLDPTGYAGSALTRREGRLTATSGAAIVAESLTVEEASRFIGARALLCSRSPGRVAFLVVRPVESGPGFTVVDVTEPLTSSAPQVVELPATGDGPAHYLVEWTFAKELAATRGDRIAFWFAAQTDVLADRLGSDAWVGGGVSGSPSAGMLLTRESLRAEGSVDGPRVSVSAGFLGYTPTPDKTPAFKAAGSP